jgi:hypothetical protein
MSRRYAPDIPPLVWLSSNWRDEPTSVRSSVGAQLGDLPIDPVAAYRPMRFRVAADDAIPFEKLPIAPSARLRLVEDGKARGAKPRDWFGVPRDIQISAGQLEGLRNGRWVLVDEGEFREVFSRVDVFLAAGKLAIRGK